MELGGVPQKIDEYFSGDLYSMYVVLQGIGSLPCIRVYIIYVIPFGEYPGCLKFLNYNVSTKKRSPEMINFLILYLKNEFFKLTEGYTPRPVSYTQSFNAKRVFACILFCSYPCFSFSFDACAFVGTMIALNLALRGGILLFKSNYLL